MQKVLALILLGSVACSISCKDSLRPDGFYAPVGSVAKVSDGDIFSMKEGETPFADTPVSIDLWMTARGGKDWQAVESMLNSGRVIFVPDGTLVDVLEHDKKLKATKVRFRGGQYIGREAWTYPRYVKPTSEESSQ